MLGRDGFPRMPASSRGFPVMLARDGVEENALSCNGFDVIAASEGFPRRFVMIIGFVDAADDTARYDEEVWAVSKAESLTVAQK